MESVATSIGILEMVQNSSFMAKAVLLILLTFSMLSWTIVVNKVITFQLARKEDDQFLIAFSKNWDPDEAVGLSKDLKFSPVARVFQTGYGELQAYRKTTEKVATLSLADLKGIAIAMDNSISQETEKLGRYLDFLATTGSTTPFIGLFGTVWGIMYSFRAIGIKGSASIGNVAPGIAEALVATAAGLLVAIPAVMFFNYLNGKIRWFGARMDNFSRNFICGVEKNSSLHAQK